MNLEIYTKTKLQDCNKMKPTKLDIYLYIYMCIYVFIYF